MEDAQFTQIAGIIIWRIAGAESGYEVDWSRTVSTRSATDGTGHRGGKEEVSFLVQEPGRLGRQDRVFKH